VTGGAHDTLRDDLAEALTPLAEAVTPIVDDDELAEVVWAVLPVVLRFADAQVAADREARQQKLIGYRVNLGSEAEPDWVMYHPSDVEVAYQDTDP
jgi:hypothetical protein